MNLRSVMFCLLAVFLGMSPAIAANVGIFQGEAWVEIGPDGPVVAKIKARNEALKQAVGKAVAQSVPVDVYQSKQKVIAKNILSKAGNYVQSFELLEARVEEGRYGISLEARINLDRLTKDVKKLGGIEVKGDKDVERILLVVTTLKLEEEEIWPALEEPIRQRLEMIGLRAVSREEVEKYLQSIAFQRYKEKRYEETYDLGETYHARYALILRSVVTSLEGAGCPSLGTARFIDCSTRNVLAEIPYSFREGVGCETAAQMEAKTLFALLTDKLQGRGIFDQAPQVAQYVSFIGLKGYRDTTELTALLKNIPDVKSISLHSFATGGRVVFQITYEGSTESLVDAVLALKPMAFKLTRRVTRDDSLVFEAEY